MATPASRLKKIVRDKELRTYDELVRYVYRYCGNTLREAVVSKEYDLRRYIDAKKIANSMCGFQCSNERTGLSKRGISGCSMTYERKLLD